MDIDKWLYTEGRTYTPWPSERYIAIAMPFGKANSSNLPAERRRSFIDAASTRGIGNYASYTYFSVSLHLLMPHWRRCDGWSASPRVDITWLELFAALVAIDLFRT